MKQKLLLLLVLLTTAATTTWAVSYRLYLDVSGTSATLKYGAYDGKPSYSSGSWYDIGDVKTTVQTITTDATSCANFSGTAINSLFSGFTALTSADLRGLKTANVIVMNNLFGGCTKLTSVDLSGWNTSKATKMGTLFNNCSSLTAVDLSSWDTSSATGMGSMFSGCEKLTSVNLSNFNTSNVETMGSMFFGCKALTTLDLSSFNTSKVTQMPSMFWGCTNLATIYVGNNWSTAEVTGSDNMFSNCKKLPNYNSSKLDKTNAHTGEGGYLSTKPYKVTLNDTKDATNWTITPAEATTTGVSKGKTVTLTYSGRLKVKSVTATSDEKPAVPPAEGHALSLAVVGEIVCSDGKAYAAADKDNLPKDVTAVAMVCYKNGSHGLALALADESSKMNWSTAISTCEGKTPTVTGCTWKLASKDEWNTMITAAGDYTALRDGFTSVGGTNMQSNWYWSSRESNAQAASEINFGTGSWANAAKTSSIIYVRAALAF